MRLIPVKYHNKNYPDSVIPLLDEVAGNLDSKKINMDKPYSLHTEYSYMRRNLDSELLADLHQIQEANKGGIPQLWKSNEWSEEYAIFIERLIGESIAPEVIEIHPPFKDYCPDIDTFWERYTIFYSIISKKYPTTKILIENRCGTMYTGSTFLFATCNDVLELCRFISKGHDELGVVIDYPQLFSAEKIKMDNVKVDKILSFNEQLKPYISAVDSIHLWGKRKSKKGNRWSAHSGDLNTFFSDDQYKKKLFIDSLKTVYDDEKERYFVPEVNTSEDDLQSIINDLIQNDISFVQERFDEYLVAIDWEDGVPKFVLFNIHQKRIRKYEAKGSFSFFLGTKKYCIGNKDIKTHEYIGCPSCAEIEGKKAKCPECEHSDGLKYCVRCSGKRCFVKRADVLSRCNHEHFVYLAYFPDNIVKVGVCHGRRKYSRLHEQGALFAYIIASCKSGTVARQFESEIRDSGIKDRVTSSYKIQNIRCFDVDKADRILMKAYDSIIEKLIDIHAENVEILFPPEKMTQQESLGVLAEIAGKQTEQLSLWDLIEGDDDNSASMVVMDDISQFQGEVLTFIGSIALLKQENRYYLYDFKKIYGREVRILRDEK